MPLPLSHNHCNTKIDIDEWQEELRQACEYLMVNFPDYRMMWAIEGFYEDALEMLAKE